MLLENQWQWQCAVNCHWLSRMLQKFAQGSGSTCSIQINNEICSLTTPGILALIIVTVRLWVIITVDYIVDVASAQNKQICEI